MVAIKNCQMNSRNNTIDLAKFIAALLVVAIHTSLFRDVNQTLYFVFNELFCRLGVPFFAICSGYFLCQKVNDRQRHIVRRQEWKLIRIYALWAFLYFLFLIPNWIETGYLSIPNCIGYLKSTILTGAYFHLWYVLYVIYAFPVFYLFIRFLRPSQWLCIAIVLWGINAFYYGYSSFLPEGNIWLQILSHIDKGYAIVKSQFVILPMLLCGAYLTEHPGSYKRNVFLIVFAFVLLIVEASILRRYAQLEKVSYIAMILPTAFFLFATLLEVKINESFFKHLGTMSLIVYCVHPMFCKYINSVTPNTIVSYIIVSLLSILVGVLWIRIKSIKNKYNML